MNSHLITLCLGGGLFAILVFIHAVVDFIFQTHFEAMNKHNNPKIRARHCLVYTIGFLPILLALHYFNAITWFEFFISVNVLFWSHFYLDTYQGVYLWAKHIRKPPEMTSPQKSTNVDGYVTVEPADPKKGFMEFIQTTLGKILMISIDQISHFAFLWPIVYMALN